MNKIFLVLLLVVSFCILLYVSGCEITGGTIVIGPGDRHRHIHPAHYWYSDHHTVIYRTYPHSHGYRHR